MIIAKIHSKKVEQMWKLVKANVSVVEQKVLLTMLLNVLSSGDEAVIATFKSNALLKCTSVCNAAGSSEWKTKCQTVVDCKKDCIANCELKK